MAAFGNCSAQDDGFWVEWHANFAQNFSQDRTEITHYLRGGPVDFGGAADFAHGSTLSGGPFIPILDPPARNKVFDSSVSPRKAIDFAAFRYPTSDMNDLAIDCKGRANSGSKSDAYTFVKLLYSSCVAFSKQECIRVIEEKDMFFRNLEPPGEIEPQISSI